MKTKTHKIIIITITALLIISSVIAFFFMPDTVPVNWDLKGNAERYGSRYETLLEAPLAAAILCIIILILAKLGTKGEHNSKSNEKLIYITGECVLTVTFVINIYDLYAKINNIQNLNTLKFDFGKLSLILLGLFMIILGNFMPKAKKNPYIGFRTPTTIKNDEAWKKGNRFAGIIFVIGGFVNIISAIFFSGVPCFFVVMAVLFIIVITLLIYTFRQMQIEN